MKRKEMQEPVGHLAGCLTSIENLGHWVNAIVIIGIALICIVLGLIFLAMVVRACGLF